MTSTTSQMIGDDGTGLLVRHWDCSDPRARMLIVHGVGEHSGRWEHVGDFFADHGIAVTSFDLRGHGASGGDRIDIEAFDEYLDDVEAVFSEIPHDLPRIMYGHSMGGVIAGSYGISERNQPDLLVLSAPALRANVPTVLRAAAKVIGRLRPGFRMENSIKGEQLSRDTAVGEKYFADPLVGTKPTARFGVKFLTQMDYLRDNFERLGVPTLVVHGSEDPLVPPAASAPLASLPNVERKLFPGLRHEIHNEPEKADVLAFILSWLDNQLA